MNVGLPERVYAVGDIHGHLDKLKAVHELIVADQASHGRAPIVHIGDYGDRGPDTKGVIQYLIDGLAQGEDWVCLKGNHDRMMVMYLQAEPGRDHRLKAEFQWLHPRLGGWETLRSYGVDMHLTGAELHAAAGAAVPAENIAFLRGLEPFYVASDVLLVHAGIRPGVPLGEQTEDDLIWIRDEFHYSRADHGHLVIHGHTPVPSVIHYGNRVNIDTGAAYGGPLSAVVVDNGQIWQITAKGRKPVSPPMR